MSCNFPPLLTVEVVQVMIMVWFCRSSLLCCRRQSYRCQEQQTLLKGEKVYLEEAMAGSSCLGMIHGRICKLMLDLEAEKELELELRVGDWSG